METLSGGQRQGVAVVRSAAFGKRVIIMDEPTAALGVRESGMVVDLIKQIRDRGIPVVLISHDMPHVFEVADRIHVHRLGQRAAVVRPIGTIHVRRRRPDDRRHRTHRPGTNRWLLITRSTPRTTRTPVTSSRAVDLTLAQLVGRARALAVPGDRHILGITGAPGAGKSTIAANIVDALGPGLAVLVPMDGFHLANVVLEALGRRDRKGAHDTFDGSGYANLLQRLHRSSTAPGQPGATDIVYAPEFRRDIEESIGSATPIHPQMPLVVTEGNYLLLESGIRGRGPGPSSTRCGSSHPATTFANTA